MERLNLNVPDGTRVVLQRLAAARRVKESEVARELLVQALRLAERDEFCRAMNDGMTPEARKRLRAIAAAQEKVRGRAR